MATPTEPVTTEPTGALFRALRSVDVEPNLAYEAAEENCRLAGENVVAVLGAKIDAQGAKIDSQGARLDYPGFWVGFLLSSRFPRPLWLAVSLLFSVFTYKEGFGFAFCGGR